MVIGNRGVPWWLLPPSARGLPTAQPALGNIGLGGGGGGVGLPPSTGGIGIFNPNVAPMVGAPTGGGIAPSFPGQTRFTASPTVGGTPGFAGGTGSFNHPLGDRVGVSGGGGGIGIQGGRGGVQVFNPSLQRPAAPSSGIVPSFPGQTGFTASPTVGGTPGFAGGTGSFNHPLGDIGITGGGGGGVGLPPSQDGVGVASPNTTPMVGAPTGGPAGSQPTFPGQTGFTAAPTIGGTPGFAGGTGSFNHPLGDIGITGGGGGGVGLPPSQGGVGVASPNTTPMVGAPTGGPAGSQPTFPGQTGFTAAPTVGGTPGFAGGTGSFNHPLGDFPGGPRFAVGGNSSVSPNLLPPQQAPQAPQQVQPGGVDGMGRRILSVDPQGRGIIGYRRVGRGLTPIYAEPAVAPPGATTTPGSVPPPVTQPIPGRTGGLPSLGGGGSQGIGIQGPQGPAPAQPAPQSVIQQPQGTPVFLPGPQPERGPEPLAATDGFGGIAPGSGSSGAIFNQFPGLNRLGFQIPEGASFGQRTAFRDFFPQQGIPNLGDRFQAGPDAQRLIGEVGQATGTTLEEQRRRSAGVTPRTASARSFGSVAPSRGGSARF